jgi:hypothetical protein
LIAAAGVVAGGIALAVLVHPHVGSGHVCEGIGFGCTPERDTDTLLIVAVYAATALTTLVVARRRFRRELPWRPVLVVGMAITALATATAVWSQLPRYTSSPGSLSAARARWERVLADGRAVAAPGTPLGDALRDLRRTGPLTCRDAYGRPTGSRRFQWSTRDARTSSGALTAAVLDRWAARLRARRIAVEIDDPVGDPASDRRLKAGPYGTAAGGVLYVRASAYIAELEITASTGCHPS